MHLQAKKLPENILSIIKVLDNHTVPTKPISLPKKVEKNNGIDSYLKKFSSQQTPSPIELIDTNGNVFIKSDYKERVTIINFWATWCPPCIEEIPSLNRLKEKLKKLPIDLISINYAEDLATIKTFMKNVNVEFPVLLDQNGVFAQQWNVITYPSTFIIDKKGKIIYGVNAAIEWDNPEVINKIKQLVR